MARTKQSLSTSTRSGSSFYRKLSPTKKYASTKRKNLSRNDEYDHLLTNLKDELTEKFEVELAERLAEATAKINKEKKDTFEDKYRLNYKHENESNEDEYESENSRQHQHPSWPWEPVTHSHQDNYSARSRRESRYAEDDNNDWRELTRYRNSPPVYKYEEKEYAPQPRRPIEVGQPKYDKPEEQSRYRYDVKPAYRQNRDIDKPK